MEEKKLDNGSQEERKALKPRRNSLDALVNSVWFSYTFMFAILMYILLCGYFLVFSGSLFVEAVANQWYSADATETDQESFLLGYLFGFPSLLGVIGGISVMASQPRSWFKFKVLLFIPAVVWSTLLVIDLLRRQTYFYLLVYHVLAMLLCLFVLFGVIKQTRVPYLDNPGDGERGKKVAS
jgi:hypothetical protein